RPWPGTATEWAMTDEEPKSSSPVPESAARPVSYWLGGSKKDHRLRPVAASRAKMPELVAKSWWDRAAAWSEQFPVPKTTRPEVGSRAGDDHTSPQASPCLSSPSSWTT